MGRKAGILLHFTSLPAPHGSGDIADAARTFIDQLVRMGMAIWQFLPTGPTAYGNSPYQSLSVFAGNPLLIGPDPLVRLGLLQAHELDGLACLPAAVVDYDEAIPARLALLARAAEHFQGGRFPRLNAAYEEFLHAQDSAWLDDYALFRILKTLHGERAWPRWDTAFAQRNAAALNRIRKRHRADLECTKFIQFMFDRQWRELMEYAAEKGVRLFGDMPIYLALDSADAWAQPELLQIDRSGHPSQVAGVPPDYFSADGQLWGNPLYDWEYHRQTGYRWWIARVKHAVRRMSLVRIDHFRGFESYWSIPAGADTARLGQWEAGPGDGLFEGLAQALGPLPIVAEDLGMITPQVVALRQRLGFPGMCVLQFEIGATDFEPGAIEPNCVCYTGTHDNDTTIGWFRGNQDDTRGPGEVARDRSRALELTGGSEQTIHLDMIRLAFSCPAALAVAPMQDVLGLGSETRLNRPGTMRGNWRWRLLPEALQPAVLDRMAEMASASGRAGPSDFHHGDQA